MSTLTSAAPAAAQNAPARGTGLQGRLNRVYARPTLAKGEDLELIAVIREDGPRKPQAVHRLLEGIQPYIVKTAREYLGRGVDLEDLIQEGNIGALEAIERFDPQRGFAYLTYADDWIRNKMLKALNDIGSVERTGFRIPSHQWVAMGRIERVIDGLREELGREPSAVELAKVAKCKVTQAKRALEVRARRMVNIDRPVADEDGHGSTVGDCIADTQSADPLAAAQARDQKQAIWAVFSELNAREREVLALRLNLDGERDADGKELRPTYEQVAVRLGLKKAEVARIQQSALSKLRYSQTLRAVAEEFVEYEDDSVL